MRPAKFPRYSTAARCTATLRLRERAREAEARAAAAEAEAKRLSELTSWRVRELEAERHALVEWLESDAYRRDLLVFARDVARRAVDRARAERGSCRECGGIDREALAGLLQDKLDELEAAVPETEKSDAAARLPDLVCPSEVARQGRAGRREQARWHTDRPFYNPPRRHEWDGGPRVTFL